MNPNTHKLRRRNLGFSLIEVLITLVVFAFGVLTVAGLQTISKKSNFQAVQRTTATMLAYDILERMRANTGQLQFYATNSLSNGTGLGGGTLSLPNPDCGSATCSPAQMETYDLYEWEQSLDGASELNGTTKAGGLVTPTACITGPPGGGAGVYTVAIAWRGSVSMPNTNTNTCGTGSGRYDDTSGTTTVANGFRRIVVIETYITPTS